MQGVEIGNVEKSGGYPAGVKLSGGVDTRDCILKANESGGCLLNVCTGVI